MLPRASHRTILVGLAVLALPTSLAVAGNLNPPGGAIAPTLKPLDKIEPRIPISSETTPGDADSVFRITQSGSYYLTGNITGQANKHGIEIAAGAVTLDLSGYLLSGGGANRLNGIEVNAFFPTSISICNGSIDGWTGNGINAPDSAGLRVQDITLTFMGGYCVWVGVGSHVSRVSAAFSEGGLWIDDHSVVQACRTNQINETSLSGASLRVGESCTVIDSSVANCSGAGFRAGLNCVFESCIATFCETGFALTAGSLTGCSASNNEFNGFFVFKSNLNGCIATENGGSGIGGGHQNVIVDCVAHANGGNGIDAGYGSVVSRCTSSQNMLNGITGSEATRIDSCSATTNSVDGIVVNRQALVTGNTCHDNDGAGIHLTTDDNRVEGNNVQDNAIGIDVDGARNLVVRNQARNNASNYTIGAGNITGTIITNQTNMNSASNDLINLSF